MLVAHRKDAAMAPDLSAALVGLVQRAARRPQWRGYPYIEEMQGDALVGLVVDAWRFDRSRGTATAFVEMVIRTHFSRRVQKEKREYKGRLLLAVERGADLAAHEIRWLDRQ